MEPQFGITSALQHCLAALLPAGAILRRLASGEIGWGRTIDEEDSDFDSDRPNHAHAHWNHHYHHYYYYRHYYYYYYYCHCDNYNYNYYHRSAHALRARNPGSRPHRAGHGGNSLRKRPPAGLDARHDALCGEPLRIRRGRGPFGAIPVRHQAAIPPGLRGPEAEQPVAPVRICGLSDRGRKGGECGVVWCGAVRCNALECSMVGYGMVWYGVVI
mmetsp:Transcript_22360/g.62222  ORF Transcript_22360/g.62222 Transcript_22360/m.62222 type:complete len:215 (-) Transcript_22360:300-944(-)